MTVELRLLDEDLLPALLDAAVAGTDPLEVMPPVDDAPGWTARRRAAFLAFHRARSVATPTPVETTYVIVAEGVAVGAVRLEPVDGGVEAGIWVSRRVRGQGVGRAAMTALLARARRRVVAETTGGNAAAIGLLRGLGGTLRVDGDDVHGELPG